MQIGVPGDPGLKALLSDQEGGEIILPTFWKNRLTSGTVKTLPSHNIRAGVAYLLMRLAIFEIKSVVDPSSSGPYNVTVKAGDSFFKIAQTQGSTVDILKGLKRASSTLKAGQILSVEKGAMKRVVSNWRTISTTTITQRYNGGGDLLYSQKLEYAFSLVKNGKTVLCE